MRAKEWRLIGEAIEEGIGLGWSHALKYQDMHESIRDWMNDQEEFFKEKLYDAIMSEISERFDFGESDQA